MSATRVAFLCLFAGAMLSGCSLFSSDRYAPGTDPDAQRRAEDPYGNDPKYINPDEYNRNMDGKNASIISMIFSDNTTTSSNNGGGPGIGVNSYLWHATLDTVSFMPLASADPFGGVIITDWYSPPTSPNERFKVNVFILGRELRADGVKTSVFRQTRDQKTGNWIDAQVDQNTASDLENAILARARQMRLSTAQK
ncbi:MAG TPA: DUF3576 domain-containing protein [Stellaceae bacterium]|jgi:hypothetical protein|nr:DUF3576 domain-containing protein [Stellaceae bacterium]